MRPATALANAEKSSTGNAIWRNLCLKWVRTMLGVPARYPTAIAAWDAVPAAHRHQGPPPPAKPGFYRGPAGSAGHVVLGIDGAGKVWSTDIRRRGLPDRCDYLDPQRGWGYTYLGWTDQLNGVDLPVASVRFTKRSRGWRLPGSGRAKRRRPAGSTMRVRATSSKGHGWVRGGKFWFRRRRTDWR